jgi:Flp pilus assembly CpaF family ATPase
MLRTAMGPDIAAALADPRVIEIMVNPDGSLRLDRLGEGRIDTGRRWSPRRSSGSSASSPATRAPRSMRPPIVSAELPPHAEGARRAVRRRAAAGLARPCFSIRKPAQRLYTLDDYVGDGIMTAGSADLLRLAVTQRFNILIAGGTSSGKTTLANALLAEMAMGR